MRLWACSILFGVVGGMCFECSSSVFPSSVPDSFKYDGIADCCDGSDEESPQVGFVDWCGDAHSWRQEWREKRALEHEYFFEVGKRMIPSKLWANEVIEGWRMEAGQIGAYIDDMNRRLQSESLDRAFQAQLGMQLRGAVEFQTSLLRRISAPMGGRHRILTALQNVCATSGIVNDKVAHGGSATVVPKSYRYTVCVLSNVTQTEVDPRSWKEAENAAISATGELVEETEAAPTTLGYWDGTIFSISKPPTSPDSSSFYALSSHSAHSLFHPSLPFLPNETIGLPSKPLRKIPRSTTPLPFPNTSFSTLSGLFQPNTSAPLSTLREGAVLRYTLGAPCNPTTPRTAYVQLVCPIAHNIQPEDPPAAARILRVIENGMCNYEITLATPIVCSPTYAKKLRQKT